MSGISKDDLESIKQNRVTDVNPTKETVDLRVIRDNSACTNNIHYTHVQKL